MPNTIALAAFVIGLVLVLAALLGTGIKIVQVELPKFESRSASSLASWALSSSYLG